MSNVYSLILLAISFNAGSSTAFTVEQVTGTYALSEGPHWDEVNNVLYFVDIPEANIYCWDPATKRLTKTHLNTGTVGVVVPVAGKKNTFLAGAGTELVELTWDPKADNMNPKVKVLSTVDVDRKGTRFNDGKVDPQGRFWAGTMAFEVKGVIPPNEGSLYRFDSNGQPTKLISPVSISNGLTWNHNNDTFYYIDSPTLEVVAYNYDAATGDISNKRKLFSLKENNISGVPDGMTIDSEGNLWIAVYNGGRVLQVCPKTGKLMRTIEIPAMKVTSAAFGGPNYDTLYVTTAKQGLSDAELKKQPLAGSVFAVHGLGVSGRQMLSCKMN